MAPKPTETSPLLPSRLQDSHAGTSNNVNSPSSPASERRQRVQQLTRRALFVVLPLAALALVGLGWLFAGTNDDDSSDNASQRVSAPKLRDTDGKSYSDAELLALLPPFVSRKHPIPPKVMDRATFSGAVPTNAFWTNLLVGDDHGLNPGGGEITLSPYTVRSLPKRLDLSYGDSRRVVTSGNITEYFNADVSFTGYSQKIQENATSRLLGDGNSTSRSIAAFDPLSATLKYHFEDEKAEDAKHLFTAHLMRGSPYFTVEYEKIIPVLELNATLLAVNQVPINMTTVEQSTKVASTQQWTSKRFELDIQVYGADKGLAQQKWILYFAQERTLQLQFADEKDYRPYNLRGEITTPTNVRLVDTDFYTGAARIAIVPSQDAVSLLDASASVYPVASSVKTSVEDLNGFVTFEWVTKSFEGSNASAKLLMLANPHHADSFSAQQVEGTKVLAKLGHRTVKSNMTAVLGNKWVFQETLPGIDFDATQQIAKPEYLEAIKFSLKNDSNYTPEAQDPYFFGKEIGRQARLALIADTVGELKARDALLNDLEKWLTPWLVGSNDNHFVYDSVWGGLCSKNGLKGIFWMTDFGNGWYNDHHFHYGYLLYSIAVVTKFRPEFGATHKAAILAITRDIASADANDTYFPFTRHFSWFDGHSFASGVYTLDGGKSQESVSEAINAYYGVYLLGKALKIPQVEHMGHILLALEIRAAKTYWQMRSDSEIYEDVYAQNKMTGQIASTKVSYTTWFGPEIEHMHLINMIPFTPITEAFISPSYVAEEYPVLQKEALERTVDPIDARWSGYAYLDLAIIDPGQAWTRVNELDFFDDGSSLTNSLYWIATRPVVGAPDSFLSLEDQFNQILPPAFAVNDEMRALRRDSQASTGGALLLTVCMCMLLMLTALHQTAAFSWRRHAPPFTLRSPAPVPTAAATDVTRKPIAVVGDGDNVNTMTFEVLQYNVFGRPYEVSKDGQRERLTRIPESLRKISESIDVVTFAEADIKDERESMLAQFRKNGYPYATSILHDPDPFTSLLNGGVIVVSKWPIIHEAQHIYRNACHYSDCLAAKGVKYARVLKTVGSTSKIFNVFATHMQVGAAHKVHIVFSIHQGMVNSAGQSGSSGASQAGIALLSLTMRRFVDQLKIHEHEPLLFAGDFNVDNHTFAAEVAELTDLLGAHSPNPIGDQQFTSDPRSNLLVGRDGAANSNKCSAKYVESWGDDKNGTYYPNALTRSTCSLHHNIRDQLLLYIQPDNMCFCPCCPLEWLDYVLYAKAPYQQPMGVSTLECRVNHVQPFVADWTAPKGNKKIQLVDLSDHYPVLGKFEFAVTRGPGKDSDPLSYHLDGCSNDDDCHFRSFRCYCTGANCYYNGTHLDGSNLDSDHPVNHNCLYQKTSFRCLCGPT